MCRPGGIRQMFKAALPMVESINKSLRTALGFEGKLQVEILDQGDAVGAWYNDSLLVVIFPTGDSITRVRSALPYQPQPVLNVATSS